MAIFIFIALRGGFDLGLGAELFGASALATSMLSL
jgi:hypothetical protein